MTCVRIIHILLSVLRTRFVWFSLKVTLFSCSIQLSRCLIVWRPSSLEFSQGFDFPGFARHYLRGYSVACLIRNLVKVNNISTQSSKPPSQDTVTKASAWSYYLGQPRKYIVSRLRFEKDVTHILWKTREFRVPLTTYLCSTLHTSLKMISATHYTAAVYVNLYLLFYHDP